MQAEQIWGLLRTILAAVGGVAVGKGWIDEQTFTAVLGGVGTIFVAVWSWKSKKPVA
mgnify:CR=1 FL=1